MSTGAVDYDVAIVGASTAGCTAARLFALSGARVALIERRPALDAYKTVCTHFIQSSATPTIEKLGLAPLIEARGALRNSADLWTSDSGWIRASDDAPHGYSLTRRRLDPILRTLAADTPGVELLAGWSAVGLLGNGRPTGVEIEHRRHERRALGAKLVVGADGRDSKVARWARVPGRVKPHGRFFYWGEVGVQAPGQAQMPNVLRPAARPGVAFVGDAALAADPMWGVGCGWAFQSADWLVQETAGTLVDDGDVDAALGRYRRRHLRGLLLHYLMICDIASGRPINGVERRLYRAAARDRTVNARSRRLAVGDAPPRACATPACWPA